MESIWVLIVEDREFEETLGIELDVAGAYVDRPHNGLILGAIREYTGVDLQRTMRNQPVYLEESMDFSDTFTVGHHKFTLHNVKVD